MLKYLYIVLVLRSNIQIWPDPYLADISGFFAYLKTYQEIFRNGPRYGFLNSLAFREYFHIFSPAICREVMVTGLPVVC